MRPRLSLTAISLAWAVALLAPQGSAHAADGKALYTQKLCVTCHGPNGQAPIIDTYPRLDGQNKAYLIQQVKDIRDGARSNGQTAAMKPIVQQVTDEEIEAIAEFLSAIQ